MRRVLLVAAAAATARAQLTEFSSHIVLDGFDVENFNRPNRLAHIELFGCLGRVFLIVFFVILFAVFNVMAFLVYQKRKREREEDAIALVPPPTYLHPSLHHKTFPGAGPAASYRGRSGAFSDELQPTESFRNVSDPQYEFGTLGGDDMGKAFA